MVRLPEDEDNYNSNFKGLSRFPNFHHSAPLTYYPQRHIISTYTGSLEIKEIPLFTEVVRRIDLINEQLGMTCVLTDNPTRLYTRIFTHSRRKGMRLEYDPQIGLFNALVVATSELTSDLRAIALCHPGVRSFSECGLPNNDQVHALDESLKECFKLHEDMAAIRNKVQLRHVHQLGKTEEVLGIVLDFEIHAHNEILLCRDLRDPGVIVLVNYDQWLMLTDTVDCRAYCRLACALNDILKSDDLPSETLLLEVYSWGDRVIQDHGMEGYMLIGEFESIVTDMFVNYPGYDPLGLGISFRESIYLMADELETDSGISATHVKKLQETLRKANSPNVLSELFGVRKHWGNPMLDAAASGAAVQEKLMDNLPVDGVALVNLLASFNRLITLEYIKKNGKWPICVFPSEDEEYPLVRAWREKTVRIPEDSLEHKHTHWARLKFQSNCVIDSYHDQLALINDRSVSLYRDHLDLTYVRALHTNHEHMTPDEERRIMLEFLRREQLEILDLLFLVMCNCIPFRWLANSAAMKGTEMKHRKARIFAVLTYELRQYFAISEDMIKDHIFKYNPHQTMTMKEVDLLEKLRSMTKQMQLESSDRTLNVIHIIDFSKWNLRMRYDNTCLVFKSIDDFMGTPGLIERTHHIFESMLNLVQDPFNPPSASVEDSDTDTIWRYHNCGWEGQRQKGWTVITSALLSQVELLTGVHSEICGQGDNQVLLSKFRIPGGFRNAREWIETDPVHVRTIVDRFYKVLERECTLIGLKVKTAETCRSLFYLNYGKRLFFNGIELSMTLKRISKMRTEPNSTYPTTEERLKTQEGNIYAAGLYGHPGLLQYYTSRVGLYLSLKEAYTSNPLCGDVRKDLLRSHNLKLGKRFLSGIMKIPASLGGPPQQQFASFLCRGHPDPLCTDLVMLRLKDMVGDCWSRKIIHVSLSGEWFNESAEDKQSLIVAPYSLNLVLPWSATKPLEHEVCSAANSYCSNPQIIDLFSSDMDLLGQEIVQILSAVEPCHPTILNDIFSRTPPGRKSAFLSGLSNSTSLSRLVQDSLDEPILSRVCKGERLQLLHWVNMWLKLSESCAEELPHYMTHDQLAQHLRDTSWQSKIVGITVPHPLEQFRLIHAPNDSCEEECDNCMPERLVIVEHQEDLISLPCTRRSYVTTIRSANSDPYLGNAISEGLSQIDLHCDNPTPSWTDAVRLNILRKWITTPGTALDEFLSQLILMRTNCPMETIDRAAGRPSRFSYSHRAALLSTIKDCSPSTTTNIHTRFYVSSNRMGCYSHGDRNYHLPFGPAFLVFEALLALKLTLDQSMDVASGSTRRVYHCHIKCPSVPIVFDENLSLTMYPHLTQVQVPQLLFSSYSSLSFTDTVGVRTDSVLGNIEQATSMDCQVMYAYQLISHDFVIEMVNHELSSIDSANLYPPRSTPISIGDIRGVGVEVFCTVLAMCALMHIPLKRMMQNLESVLLSVCYRFLDCYSLGFWEHFSVPMSNFRNLEELQRLAEGISTFNLTRNCKGVVPLIKIVVSKKMVCLWKDLKDRVMLADHPPQIVLACPSVRALRPVLSRYYELCLVVLHEYSELHPWEIIAHARDMVAEMHTITEDKLLGSLPILSQSYLIRSREVLGFASKSIPIPKIYSTRDPWVDRLRDLQKAPKHHFRRDEKGRAYLQPEFAYYSYHSVPLDSTLYLKEECSCPEPDRPRDFHLECYYTPTGISSKSHYKFLEIIFSFNLPIHSIACLGTSTGTEAAAISVCNENKWVYVNCYHTLSGFDAHSAATYTPPAFLAEGVMRKLLRPSSAVLATSDLLNKDCILSIFDHLDGYNVSGVTCDAEMPGSDAFQSFGTLLDNLNLLVSLATTIQWVIVKIPIWCHHHLTTCMSQLSQHFEQIHTIYSSFNRAKSRNLHLLVIKRRLNPLFFDCFTLYPGMSDVQNYWGSALHDIDCSSVPPCFRLPHASMIAKMNACGMLSSSFSSACNTIMRGMSITRSKPESLREFEKEVKEYSSVIVREAADKISSDFRFHSVLPLVRGSVLDKNAKPLDREIHRLYNEQLRTIVLLSLLRLQSPSLSDILEVLDDFVASRHTVEIKGEKFRVPVHASHFISRVSRFLIEIYGTVSGHQMLSYGPSNPRVIHRVDTMLSLFMVDMEHIFEVTSTNCSQSPISAWKWNSRSQLLSILYVCFILHPDKVVNVQGISVGVLTEVALRQLRLTDRVLIGSHIMSDITLLFNPTYQELCSWLSGSNTTYVYLDYQIHCEMSTKVSLSCKVFPPWSGIVPNSILSLVLSLKRTVSDVMYPNIQDCARRINPLGLNFCGCACYSCVFEQHICEEVDVSHSVLDRLCSLGKIENIFDKSHSM